MKPQTILQSIAFAIILLVICLMKSSGQSITQEVSKNFFSEAYNDKYILLTRIIQPCDSTHPKELYFDIDLGSLEYLTNIKCSEYQKAKQWLVVKAEAERKADEEKARLQRANNIKCE